jgi:hypothetical protein
VGDMERVCHSAVFISIGVLGRKNFRSAVGEEESILVF